MCIASSPLPGWLTSSVSSSTPSFLAQLGSRACSASMKAAMPPAFWARAMTCRASVVLPLDSGPKISTIRPLGMPCPPRAMSSDRLPVGMPAIGPFMPVPSGMIEPLRRTASRSAGRPSSAPDALPSRVSPAAAGSCFPDGFGWRFLSWPCDGSISWRWRPCSQSFLLESWKGHPRMASRASLAADILNP